MGCGSSNALELVKISPYELEILKNETDFSKDEIKAWYGAFMDENPGSLMNKAGFISLYSRLYPAGSVEDFSERLFAAYDSDKSGTIDFKEFISVMNIANKGTPIAKLNWAFGLYDTDNSGQLTRTEVTEIVTAIYKMQGVSLEGSDEHISAQGSVDQIFKALEKDDDGEISLEEFVKASQANQKVCSVLTSI